MSKFKKRTLLINPRCHQYVGDLKRATINFGLLSIGSFVSRHGHDVKIIHADLGDEISGLAKGWNNLIYSSEDGIGSLKKWGLSDEDIIDRIKKYSPDVIGISCPSTAAYPAFIEIAEISKKASPKSFIVGGGHLTSLAEKALRNSKGIIDLIILGEGEEKLEEILEHVDDWSYLKKLRGLVYLENDICYNNFLRDPIYSRNGSKVFVGKLDILGDFELQLIEGIPLPPVPTHGAFAMDKNGVQTKYIDVVWSRGCTNDCAFCGVGCVWPKFTKTYSTDFIDRNLGSITQRGYGHIITNDDNLTSRMDWLREVLKLYNKHGITWQLINGIDFVKLEKDIIDLMRSMGLTSLFCPLNMREWSKHISDADREKYIRILSYAKEKGVYVFGSIFTGFPTQTIQDMEKEIEFAREIVLKGYADFMVIYSFTLLPGSAWWDKMMRPIDKGEWIPRQESGIYFPKGVWGDWSGYSLNTPQFGMDRLYSRTHGKEGFKYEEYRNCYYDWVKYVNGDKAEQWFDLGVWPK